MKFKGAGQGTKALIAELIGCEIARKLGFLVPELAFGILDEGFGRTEPDEEIQDLLKMSTGTNLLMDYLQGAITYDPTVTKINSLVASTVVWFDSLITNVDRTAKNTNMLMWRGDLWLIDHGASLYFHHNWDTWEVHSKKTFALIKNHVLLPQASKMDEANELMKDEINEAFLNEVLSQIPDEWLGFLGDSISSDTIRATYKSYILNRLAIADQFTKEAHDAR
jgi:hypothetical protein